MFYVLHYTLISCGQASIVVLLAVYLQTYSAASMSEIGSLLMILPFFGTIVRPFVCAMADRAQAHRLYLIIALIFSVIGYGSLIIAPFFPKFIQDYGHIVWYLDILGICIGFSAYAMVWALGDALAVVAARRRGIPWGFYRACATFAWGVFGVIIGQVNELPILPKYTPGMIMFMIGITVEILLLLVWPKEAFKIDTNDPPKPVESVDAEKKVEQLQIQYSPDLSNNPARFNSLRGSNANPNKQYGSVRSKISPLAAASVILDDIGDTISSTLSRSSTKKRPALAEILAEHRNLTDLGMKRSQSSKSVVKFDVGEVQLEKSKENKEKEAAAVAAMSMTSGEMESAPGEVKVQKDLQIVLLKLIIRRDPEVLKFLAIFVLYGILLFVHMNYLFLQVEGLCREKGYRFSLVVGSLLAAQSVSEVFGFLVLTRYYMPLVGRPGTVVSIAVLFMIRYAFYGTYFPQVSPYWAICTEVSHGFAFSLIYTLMTDVASSCVDKIDEYIPELLERGIIDSSMSPGELKLPLRTTILGLASGAFDGLGCGIGGLVGGIFLDHSSFENLWLTCTVASLLCATVYPLIECKWGSSKSSGTKAQSVSR